MIGKFTSAAESLPRRWIRRAWGVGDVNARQKWTALWPWLQNEGASKLRVLDAGCGSGLWALELGARRKHWCVVGIDRDRDSIEMALAQKQNLGLTNVDFFATDFRKFEPDEPFDLILSVASAHYMIGEGDGELLFRQFWRWTTAGAKLLVLCTRPSREIPFVSWLPTPELSAGISAEFLSNLCRASGWDVISRFSCVGRFGTIAKQLMWAARRRRGSTALCYPIALASNALDCLGYNGGHKSCFNVIFAGKRDC